MREVQGRVLVGGRSQYLVDDEQTDKLPHGACYLIDTSEFNVYYGFLKRSKPR